MVSYPGGLPEYIYPWTHVHCGGVHDRGCLLIMGSFSLIAINANHVLGDLEDDNQFLAYIDDSLTRAQTQALESQIKAVPNVADIHFVTKEEALANFKANQER